MLDSLQELIHICLAGINIPYTLLFGVMLIYWLSVIFGAMDIDILQFDFDVEVDPGGDIDFDADGDASVESGGSFNGVLLYFNIGTVPVTIWLSFVIFSLWYLALIETYYFNPSFNFLISLAFLIPNLIISLHIAKFLTLPLKKVFAAMDSKAVTRNQLVGKIATVTSTTVSSSFGQILIKTDGAPLTLNARSDKEIPKGQTVVLIQELEPGTFDVEPFSE